MEPAAENLAARLLCFCVCRGRALVIVLGPLVAAAGLSLQTRLEPDGGGASCVLNAARRVAFSAARIRAPLSLSVTLTLLVIPG